MLSTAIVNGTVQKLSINFATSRRSQPGAVMSCTGPSANTTQCSQRDERLERAKGYPYPRPQSSYIYVNGKAYTFSNLDWTKLTRLEHLPIQSPGGSINSLQNVLKALGVDVACGVDLTAMTGVLAIGSNAAPAQLARKFTPDLFPDGVVIPVVQCVLRDFDVVYAPLITSYGSAAATLAASPGCSVALWMTLLPEPLLQRMHETEGAYDLRRLTRVTLHLPATLARADGQSGCSGPGIVGNTNGAGIAAAGDIGAASDGVLDGVPCSVLDSALVYTHQAGALQLPVEDGQEDKYTATPIALEEIACHNRAFPSLSQQHMLMALRHALATGAPSVTPRACNTGPAAVPLRPIVLPPGWRGQAGGRAGEGLAPAPWACSEQELDTWVLSNLDDDDVRRHRVQRLLAAARPLAYDHAELLVAIGSAFSRNVH